MAKSFKSTQWGQIYDNIYGFIRLTRTEERIINSPYYQRLRWIKQLGFATYIFPGAEHTRFAHAIGAMHSADLMIRALGKHVPDEKLFNPAAKDKDTLFHKSCRLAALLHDIGTFPFSHSIEESYIRHGKKLEQKGKLPGKKLPNNHEHLGSYIIKNSKGKNGITTILQDDGIDPGSLSKYIKGESDNMVANQILHSDLDADRLDYLVRDAHHTGIKYGLIDRDYLLYHLTTFTGPQNREYMAIRSKGIHAVEDFLLARFSWYSQVVKNPSSAKFDVLAAHIASHLLSDEKIISFHQLLKLVDSDPERFFTFNDVYFMNLIQDLYLNNKVKNPVVREQMRMLIFREAPATIRINEFQHRILEIDSHGQIQEKPELLKKIQAKVDAIHKLFAKKGDGTEWIIVDLPSKDVIFTKDVATMMKKGGSTKALYERDPIKVVHSNGTPSLLAQTDNSLLHKLARYVNFIPNLYANQKAADLIKAHGLEK